MEEELEKPIEPIETPELIARRKHTAMLERLSILHQSRLQQSAARRSAVDSSPSESVQSFLTLFGNAKRSVETDLHQCRTLAASNPEAKSQIKSKLDEVSASISDVEKLVAQQSYFLPPYEVRSSLQTIVELKEMVESANADLIPRKKFSFKSKAPSKKEPTAVFAEKAVDFNKVSEAAKPNFCSRDSPGFRNERSEVLVKKFRAFESEGEFSLADLESCDVYIKGRMRALFIHRLKDCRIFSGPVLGSILIEEVNSCFFMLSSHQIRIHQASECDFYLRVRSRPIVEDCSSVRFAPYRLFYKGIDKDLSDSGLDEETGNWASVDDFRWLRAVQSPNWSLIPEEEYVDVRDVSELEEKSDEKQLC